MTARKNDSKDLISIQQDSENNLRWDWFIEFKKIDTFHEMLFKAKLWSLSKKDKSKVKKDLIGFITSL